MTHEKERRELSDTVSKLEAGAKREMERHKEQLSLLDKKHAADVLKSALLDETARGRGDEQKEDAQRPPSSECVVCLDAPAAFAVLPGGHKCLCGDCLASAEVQCPVCRTPASGTARIFET